jgi:hypothetical protein
VIATVAMRRETPAPASAWERELASVLVDIARKPDRHAAVVASDPPPDPGRSREEALSGQDRASGGVA